eukprot:scaffold149777_cov35-Attheya_sp.AAC.3
MITTSPTRYDEARLAKSDDNNETYDATLQESTITMPQFINDPDNQYQKEDENDIQCTSDTTRISTTMSTSPTRYDVQDIDNHNKQYCKSLHIIESHATARNHPIRPLKIAIPPYAIMTKPQTTHSPTFRPTEDIVTLTHAQTKAIYNLPLNHDQLPDNHNLLPNIRNYRGTSTSDSCEDNQHYSYLLPPTSYLQQPATSNQQPACNSQQPSQQENTWNPTLSSAQSSSSSKATTKNKALKSTEEMKGKPKEKIHTSYSTIH